MKTHDVFVRWAEPDDMARVREMWTYAFTDSPAFVDWAFGHYVNIEEVLIAGFDGIAYASLQIIDFPVWTPAGKLNGRYVVGVNCFPEARGLGLTQMLMNKIHEEAVNKGIDLFVLMPFEANFYLNYDYIFGTYHARTRLEMSEFPKEKRVGGRYERIPLSLGMASELEGRLNPLYEAWHEARFDFYQVRDKRQWRAFIDDLALEGGSLVLWQSNAGVAEGYLAYSFDGERFFIREMVALNDDARRALSYFISSHRSQKKHLIWSAPVDEPMVGRRPSDKDGVSLHPFMMFRMQDITKISFFAKCLPSYDLKFAVEGQGYCWLRETREIEKISGGTSFEVQLSLKELNEVVFSPSYFNSEYKELKDLRACFRGLSNYLNTYF